MAVKLPKEVKWPILEEGQNMKVFWFDQYVNECTEYNLFHSHGAPQKYKKWKLKNHIEILSEWKLTHKSLVFCFSGQLCSFGGLFIINRPTRPRRRFICIFCHFWIPPMYRYYSYYMLLQITSCNPCYYRLIKFTTGY